MGLCLHKWSKWTDPYPVTVQRLDKWGDEHTVQVTVQDRTCDKCNKVQTRYISDGDIS